MATKDITDKQVIEAYKKSILQRSVNLANFKWPETILMQETGQCEKVCFSAMNRAEKNGYIEYGVSLRSGWLTDKAKDL